MALLPELLTAREVAAALRVDISTVNRWARAGDLKRLPLPGRSVRFRREDVEALMAPKPS